MGDIPQNVREDLECTICLEISVSPIQSCVNGHLVCAICYEKVKICGLCKESLQPNGFVERLARKYEIAVTCRNEQAGCSFIPKSFDLIAHLQECQYRPIQCFAKNTVDCNGQIIQFNQFHKHLKDIHKLLQLDPILEACSKSSFNFLTNELNSKIANMWEASCMQYDDKIFLLFTSTNAFGLSQWVTVIGGKEEAEMYKCILTLVSPEKTPVHQVEYKWTLPVLPLRNNHIFASIAKSGCFASIQSDALQPFCGEKESNGVKYKFSWTVQFQIVKK